MLKYINIYWHKNGTTTLFMCLSIMFYLITFSGDGIIFIRYQFISFFFPFSVILLYTQLEFMFNYIIVDGLNVLIGVHISVFQIDLKNLTF